MLRSRSGRTALGPAFLGQIDDLRLYSRALTTAEVEDLAIHYRSRAILSGVNGKRSKEQADYLREYFLTYAAPEKPRVLYSELEALQKQKEAAEKPIPTTMVMAEMKKPRETFVLARGDYRNQTEKVQPGVPAMLPPLEAGRAAQSADAREVARAARASAHVARRGESLLADVLRTGHRQDAGGLRRAGRAAGPSRSCSTGWPPSSSARAGTSGRCSG